jgi:aquaporin Z
MAKNIYFAEFIGAFTLVFFGCGAIMINELYPQLIGNMGIATTFGLIVMIMIYSLGNVSGAHINPAVSIAFVLANKLEKNKAVFYIISQVFGAIFASFLLFLILPETTTLGQTNPNIFIISAFIVEFLASFFLMLVILNVATGHKETGIMVGVAIGALILIEALIFGPLTGASMNPARSIGPALISFDLANLWCNHP